MHTHFQLHRSDSATKLRRTKRVLDASTTTLFFDGDDAYVRGVGGRFCRCVLAVFSAMHWAITILLLFTPQRHGQRQRQSTTAVWLMRGLMHIGRLHAVRAKVIHHQHSPSTPTRNANSHSLLSEKAINERTRCDFVARSQSIFADQATLNV